MDDPFYRNRYDAKVRAVSGQRLIGIGIRYTV
jgi:hypothetical protein